MATYSLKAKLQNFIGLVVNSGLTAATDPHIVPFIKQTNSSGLLFFVLDLILAPTFYFISGNSMIAIGLVVSGFTFLLSTVGLNAIGFINLSRLSTAGIGTILIFFCGFLLGPNANPETSLLLGAIIPFTQFHLKEYKKILFTLLYPMISFYAFQSPFFLEHTPVIGLLSESDYLLLSMIFFLIPYLCIVAHSAYFVWQHNSKTEALALSENHLSTVFKVLSHDLGNPLQVVSL